MASSGEEANSIARPDCGSTLLGSSMLYFLFGCLASSSSRAPILNVLRREIAERDASLTFLESMYTKSAPKSRCALAFCLLIKRR